MMNYQNTAKENYPVDGGYAANSLSQLPPDNPIVAAAMTFQQTQELCQRVRSLADRLLGPVPQAVDANRKASGATNAIFPALKQSADDVMADVQSASAALNRIENIVP